MITGINHIGIVVNSIDETLKLWRAIMGATELGRAHYANLGQISAMVRVGDSYFELMEPLGEDGVIPDFLKKHGEGIHHVSIHSDNLPEDKAVFELQNVRVLGNEDDPVVFTHPKTSTGIVFEMTESRNGRVDL